MSNIGTPLKPIALDKRIIFALDVPTAEEAKTWVIKLEKDISFYKVGLQLFLASGFEIVDWIVERDLEVMLDLKFYDIPQTVASAISQLNGRGVSLTTVHGDSAIMKAAVGAKKDVSVLAVTVLTSMNEADLKEMGIFSPVQELVLKRAHKALDAGCDGIVASGLEVSVLRKELGGHFLIIAPGVRPFSSPQDDQKRVVDLRKAFRDGADHVVIGRPIRDALEPLILISQMKETIQEALASRAQTTAPT